MDVVKTEMNDDVMQISLSGHIDSGNAPMVEKEVFDAIQNLSPKSVVIDAGNLEYISSAGLRVLLRVRKSYPGLIIRNVSTEVYDILQTTGFTEMITVEKAYRSVSIEGCEEIGRGANGSIYRIDKDNVVKVYNDVDALDEIQNEREVARKALVLGIPTAISYDIVKVAEKGNSFGSVFELLDGKSFSEILASEPDKLDWCVKEYVKMLRTIHSTLVPKGDLPDFKERAIGWAREMQDHLPEEYAKKLMNLIVAIPHDDHMIHGDYHTKNLMLTGGEVLLIDMDTLSVGHPILELGSVYNAFIGYSEYDHNVVKKFQGFDYETSVEFWKKFLVAYLGTDDEEKIKEVEDKIRVLGYTRLIRRAVRVGGLETEEGKAEINLWKERLIELLDRVNTLEFLPYEVQVEADTKNLAYVTEFIEKHLESIDCPLKVQMQISVAIDEIFSNIAYYAYAPMTGDAIIGFKASGEPTTIEITFKDNGVPFNPLERDDPDTTASADERTIGGLGIFMVKKSMDDVTYEYKDEQNVLTIKKKLE